jgi:beta-lactamase class A
LQRKTGCFVWVVIAVAITVLFLVWQYRGYRLSTDTLPPDVTMADLPVGGMTRAQALNALQVAFSTPLMVTYRDHTVSLAPGTVSLQYDADQTAFNLNSALDDRRGLRGFLSYVLRQDQGAMTVPVAVTFSNERLSYFLARVADRYDEPPRKPVALPATLDFREGQAGSTLNAAASRVRLANALVSAAIAEVELVVEVEQPPGKDLSLLEQLLQSRLDDHADLIPGVFVKDLKTGDELVINGDVAYAGMSVLKIAVLEEVYRELDEPPGPETSRLISETVTESDNVSAHLLLRDVVDDGDGLQAAEELTASMNRLGLVNTYMAASYDDRENALEIVTPANSRTDISTDPDPFIQTTPLDIGLLLEMIYQCSRGGGALVMTYPEDLNAEECQEMIKWMSQNRIDSLIDAGVPPGTQVAHKHGWTSDTHADAGIVFTPGGDFVLVVFLHRPQWLEWEESAPLIADVSTAAYNYFNPAR